MTIVSKKVCIFLNCSVLKDDTNSSILFFTKVFYYLFTFINCFYTIYMILNISFKFFRFIFVTSFILGYFITVLILSVISITFVCSSLIDNLISLISISFSTLVFSSSGQVTFTLICSTHRFTSNM